MFRRQNGNEILQLDFQTLPWRRAIGECQLRRRMQRTGVCSLRFCCRRHFHSSHNPDFDITCHPIFCPFPIPNPRSLTGENPQLPHDFLHHFSTLTVTGKIPHTTLHWQRHRVRKTRYDGFDTMIVFIGWINLENW